MRDSVSMRDIDWHLLYAIICMIPTIFVFNSNYYVLCLIFLGIQIFIVEQTYEMKRLKNPFFPYFIANELFLISITLIYILIKLWID